MPNLAHPGLPVDGLLRRAARRDPDGAAVRTANRSVSFAELDAWADRTAGFLHRALDGAAGARVGVANVLDPVFAAAYYGTARSGGGVTADLTGDLWYDVIDTNLNSVFLVTREALGNGGLAGSGHGRIISITSTAGEQGVLLGAPYSASKHGVVGFTKALGRELAPRGITVNAVCPGYVETPMAQRVRQEYAVAWDTTEDHVRARFAAKIPLGRYSTPVGGGRAGRLPDLRARCLDHRTGPQHLRWPGQLLTFVEEARKTCTW